MSSKLVLVLNCGSSSLKFAILDAVNGDEYLSGLAECFHLPEARIKWKIDGGKQEAELGAGAAHSEALNFIVNTILAQKPELSAQYKEHGVRRYGAHGTSHFYVTQEAAKILNKPVEELNIITCHLGNGGSVSAIRNGKCVDTSMGLTPLEGLVMGTRSGDIDPAIIFHLHDTLGMSVDAINKMLTKESGLLGLTEVTSDCRYVEDNYQEKADAKRAMDVYCHRLAKYIGSYTALMDGRLDAVVFTGGIGENAAMVRELSLGKLGVLGFEVDHERNLAARFGKSGFINKEGTRPAVVIPTNEELVIAQDASRLTA